MICDYTDDEKQCEDQYGEFNENLKKIQIVDPKTILEESLNDEEIENDSDIEIFTTSELKINSRSYLLPGLKSGYFPLKASIRLIDEINQNKLLNSLIAVEKSNLALTFLGTQAALSNGIEIKKRLKLSDILYK